MLKIWLDIWSTVVRQLFIRQVQISESRRQSFAVGPPPSQIDTPKPEPSPTPAIVVTSDATKAVAVGAEIKGVKAGKRVVESPSTSSDLNRHRSGKRTHNPVLPSPATTTTPSPSTQDPQRTRRSHKRGSSRRSGNNSSASRLTKPLPPIPGTFLAVPSQKPSAPLRLSRTSAVINLRSSKVSGRLSTMAEETAFRDLMKASYDYDATAEDELTLKDEQLLYLLAQLDDDWSKVQAHTPLEHLADTEAAVGLVPAAYIEPAVPIFRATALYDYEPNGEGEIAMHENDKMNVYLKEDEWILVKLDGKAHGKQPFIGYVPANYIEEGEGGPADAEAQEVSPIPARTSPTPQTPSTPYLDPAERAAAAVKKMKDDPVQTWSVSEVDKKGKKKKGTLGVGNGSIFFASESDKAPVQQWSSSAVSSVHVGEDKHKLVNLEIGAPSGDLSLQFNAGSASTAEAIVDKIQSSKRLASGDVSSPPTSPSPSSSMAIKSPTPSAPDNTRSLPPPAHPGMSPSPNGKSKGVRWDTAPPAEIAPDPRGVQSEDEEEAPITPAQSSGATSALAMFDFDADGEDELSVKEGDKLTVLDQDSSSEWWTCRNAKGKEGVVPASYLKVDGAVDDGQAEAEAARAAEETRKEQERAAAAAAKVKRLADENRRKREAEARQAEERRQREEANAADADAVSQKQKQDEERRAARREEEERQSAPNGKPASTNGTKNTHARGQSKDLPGRPSLDKPKPTNTRVWHDRSGQFKVEAQFLGVHNGKIRLHKVNGVIIEVPEEKMSPTDMEYIKRHGEKRREAASSSRTQDEDNVPLGELSRRPTSATAARPTPTPPRRPTVDWFEFFLSAGCDLDDCTRYQASFERDKIDEAILPDIKPETLRALGLREGDIIRVTKKIEERNWKTQQSRSNDPKVQEQMKKDAELAQRLQEQEYNGRTTPNNGNSTTSPGLFTAPGGALRNNTRRGRPPPTKSSTLGVDTSSIANASEQLSRTSSPSVVVSPVTTSGAAGSRTSAATSSMSGFDDDAWTPRPASAAGKPAPTPVAPPPRTPSVPAVAPTPPPPPPPPAPTVQPPAPVVQPNPTQAAGQSIQRPATSNAPTSTLPDQFAVLAKIGSMRPPSAPIQQRAPTITSQSGFAYGSGGQAPFLNAQATGAFSPSPLQSVGGPRAPFAPVPANESLLKPLIPTNTGFNSFIPTRSVASPLQTGQPSFLTQQPTGFNQGSTGFNQGFGQSSLQPLQANPTGFGQQPSPMFQNSFSQPSPATTSSGFSTLSGYNTASSGFQTPSPIPPQATGFGGYQGQFGTQPQVNNPGNNFLSTLQSHAPGSFNAPPNVNPAPDTNNPANIFASMKAGSFANTQAPQDAGKYDALRPQPTGWNALNGLQPQATGFQQQGFQTGFQPGFQPGFQQQQPQGYQNTGYGFQ